MYKSIIIYDDNITLDIFSKYDLIKCKSKIYMIYDGKIFNPPIFELIVITKNNISDNDLKMLWNMITINGKLIILKKFKHFFNQFDTQIIQILNDYIEIKKIDKLAQIIDIKYRIVDFIIMGTQKGGTTSAQLNLAKNNDIFLYPEEIHYFDLNLKRGLNWYMKHFDYNKKMVGEKTPELMYLEYTFPYIQSLNPSLKIILFLRNPVMRAFSAWKMDKNRNGLEYDNFETCIDNEIKYRLNENKNFHTASYHYLQRGLYYKQIKNIIKWFQKENILILISENVATNMTTEYNKIYSFLGVKLLYDIDYKKERVSNSDETIDKNTYNNLINFFKKDIKKLEKFIGYKTNWL